MAECIKCGEYTKFNGRLCSKCYAQKQIENTTNKSYYTNDKETRNTGGLNDKDYPYRNAYIILVSKKHIKCVTVEELEAGEEITPSSRNYLGNRKEFDLDKQTIIDFCDFAVQFFQTV